MNGSRVRDGEGRFITFYFIIFYTISFFILKKNTKVINLPSPWTHSLAHRLTRFYAVLILFTTEDTEDTEVNLFYDLRL